MKFIELQEKACIALAPQPLLSGPLEGEESGFFTDQPPSMARLTFFQICHRPVPTFPTKSTTPLTSNTRVPCTPPPPPQPWDILCLHLLQIRILRLNHARKFLKITTKKSQRCQLHLQTCKHHTMIHPLHQLVFIPHPKFTQCPELSQEPERARFN